MTYCVGILVRDGLVMIGDTRTNAGLDNIAIYRKLHVFENSGERIVAVATSGNLSISQSALSLLSEGLQNPDTGETETRLNVSSMFKAAQLVGRAVRKLCELDGAALERQGISFDMMALVGGQIGDGRLRLFQIYSAGNFIETTADTPFLQIGEHKYGKPILDRAITYDVDLYDALKIGLISMDSTMRSRRSSSIASRSESLTFMISGSGGRRHCKPPTPRYRAPLTERQRKLRPLPACP